MGSTSFLKQDKKEKKAEAVSCQFLPTVISHEPAEFLACVPLPFVMSVYLVIVSLGF